MSHIKRSRTGSGARGSGRARGRARAADDCPRVSKSPWQSARVGQPGNDVTQITFPDAWPGRGRRVTMANPVTSGGPQRRPAIFAAVLAVALPNPALYIDQARRLRRRGPGVSAGSALKGPPAHAGPQLAGLIDQEDSPEASQRTA